MKFIFVSSFLAVIVTFAVVHGRTIDTEFTFLEASPSILKQNQDRMFTGPVSQFSEINKDSDLIVISKNTSMPIGLFLGHQIDRISKNDVFLNSVPSDLPSIPQPTTVLFKRGKTYILLQFYSDYLVLHDKGHFGIVRLKKENSG